MIRDAYEGERVQQYHPRASGESEVKPTERDGLARIRVALIGWGNCFEEDFLQKIGVSIDEFCESFRGSWAFGYADALACENVELVSYYFSTRIRSARRLIHRPTSTVIWFLPTPVSYRIARRLIAALSRAAGERLSSRLLGRLRRASEYLATPLMELSRRVRSEGCRAVLVQGYDCPRFDLSILLGRWMRLPVYATYQGGGDFLPSRLEASIRRRALRRSAGLIVAPDSEVARIQLRYGFSPDRVARIMNPVDTQFWRPIDRREARRRFNVPSDTVVVCWHGRVDIAHKGLDILCEAWRHVTVDAECEKPLLLLVGTGADSDRLRTLLADQSPYSVRWIDHFVTDPADLRALLSLSDIYVFPSRHEGLAVAPIEAMACGLVVAASTTGFDLQDLLSTGETGPIHLIEPLDAGVCAEVLKSLICNSRLRDNGREPARKVAVENFSTPLVGRQLAAFLAGKADGYRTGRTSRQDRLVLHRVDPQRISKAPAHQSAAVSVVCEGATPGTFVAMDGEILLTTYGSRRVLSAVIPPHVLRHHGCHTVRLTDGVRLSGDATIYVDKPDRHAATPPAIMRIIPDRTVAGAALNRQQDGSSALAVECENARPETLIIFDGTRVETTYGGGSLLTARIPAEFLASASRHLIHLTDARGSSRSMEFVVAPADSAPDDPR